MTELETQVAIAKKTPGAYVEFLRVPAMSVGVYVLSPGDTDRQSPHTVDEVYYVVRGHARFRLRDGDDPVGPGDVLPVPAQEPHHFHSVTEELVLLVVFAPARTPTK
jgi:mannose-6-phosphate isomerase-like protein (cupin superfamily)